MVTPNMGAFIARGFITALFTPAGWIPNEGFNELVAPVVKYMLPMTLAYSGGKLVHDRRGATAGYIGTFGLIAGSEVNIFLGVMVMEPLSTWCIKQFDRLIDGEIPAGFEMVANNFSLGTIATILSLYSHTAIGPAIEFANEMITSMITLPVKTELLPLLLAVNEPAKVLSLNNATDQGAYHPSGMQQAAEVGRSIFFMAASNLGAGLGLLLAFSFFGKGNSKKTVPGAIIIHFLGGIHGIYFPYVLMKPLIVSPTIIGLARGITVFGFFGADLVVGPSPDSIFVYLALTPRGNSIGILAGVVTATVISFLLASLILKTSKDNGDEKLEKSIEKSKAMKQEGKDLLASSLQTEAKALKDIAYIAFTCDAGLGSSVLGAIALKKCPQKIGVERTVCNYATEKVPDEADVTVAYISLLGRACLKSPNRRTITTQNFMSDPNLDALFEEISNTEN